MNCKKLLIFTATIACLTVAALGQSITVTAPNGGERWTLGDTVTITWTASDIGGDVRILLLGSGGTLIGTIASAVPVTPGSFSWEAGALATGTAAAGENYVIRIRSNRLDLWDNSNGTFALVGHYPNIKISTMKAIGHTHTVIPPAFAAGDTVAVQYYLQNDSSYAAGAFNVGLRVGGAIVARNPYPALVNGGEASGEFTWTATCGSPVAVVADCDGAVTENNEGDNVMTDPELACTQPNLMFFRDLNCSSGPTVKANLNYRFAATMHSDLVGTRNVRVTGGVVGGAVLYDETFAELAPEALQEVSFVWEVPEGAHRVYFAF